MDRCGPRRRSPASSRRTLTPNMRFSRPAREQFRIRFLPEETRAGATELVNATRGGSEGSDVEVYDPRTGKPLKFTYQQARNDPETHAIHATLPIPVPRGRHRPRADLQDLQRCAHLHDARRRYRLGPQPERLSARRDPAARLRVHFVERGRAADRTDDGRLKLAFANPSGQSNPVTIHARKTAATFAATPYTDMFFDDIKTLYDLDAPETHKIKVEQTYSDYRKGDTAKLDSLAYLSLQDLKVIDLDTAKPFDLAKTEGRHRREARSAHHGPQTKRAYPHHRHVTGCELTREGRRSGLRPHAARTAQHRAAAGRLGSRGRLAIGHRWHESGPGVCGAYQSQRRE